MASALIEFSQPKNTNLVARALHAVDSRLAFGAALSIASITNIVGASWVLTYIF